eukprot:g14698.t1
MIEVPHPGEFLAEELEARGWSQRDLAYILGVSEQGITQIVNGRRGISPEMAKALGDAFDVNPEFFTNLQKAYDLSRAKEPDPGIAKRALFQGVYPIREMIRRGWLEDTDVPMLEGQLMRFFRTNDVGNIPHLAHAAKKSDYESDTPEQLAWLYRVRQICAEMVVPKYSKKALRDAVENQLPALMAAPEEAGFTSSVGLDPSLTFAAFVTGETNILGKNAAERMAATEQPQFSPLYLKAATGQGKTHLLHAIGHAYLQAHPRARIFYCSAERFMVEFVQALKANQMIEFKARLRSFDLLLVDDIQFIIGKASAQEELLYTIDALLAEGKRLVFAADRAPQALDGVEPRLLSRLSMGLVADIQPADIELRRKILESKLARFAPLNVPDDVVDFLARTITRNVRELVGGLNKLIAYAQLTGQEVSLNLAEEQLTDILSANRRRITIDEIQRTVCQFYRIDRSEMSSKRRARAVVRPRQVAMYLSKVLTPRSYPEIGRKFGGRDHSTVIHAVRLIEDLRKRDADMDGDVRSLLRQLES